MCVGGINYVILNSFVSVSVRNLHHKIKLMAILVTFPQDVHFGSRLHLVGLIDLVLMESAWISFNGFQQDT
jgi:hypothetical protein